MEGLLLFNTALPKGKISRDLFFSGEDLTHAKRLQRMGTVPSTDLLSFITLINQSVKCSDCTVLL